MKFKIKLFFFYCDNKQHTLSSTITVAKQNIPFFLLYFLTDLYTKLNATYILLVR